MIATLVAASMPRVRVWAAEERPVSRAVILVGLPGDKEHEDLFADAIRSWCAWLTGPLRFDPAGQRFILLRGIAQGENSDQFASPGLRPGTGDGFRRNRVGLIHAEFRQPSGLEPPGKRVRHRVHGGRGQEQ
jgi:hypothetical protein